ncbi:ankyrin [endosymbiont of Acanthamoeba sp. UWC8]|uniref:ankyrin repeat domain-containing protein n=1 Tax=endosymbiont of Acanthamoeba sp. UWC8 TaxID=86106 RepID=UPI0004D1C5FE|nr:ankyrin repeat domain-containing protein [endosymbiont of Acanthamoeba sp. UWC8]AIF82025.1 ankyrin [endosymbiont of Acanthamoeba sp. UWC8]
MLEAYGEEGIEYIKSFLKKGGNINEKDDDGSEMGLLYYAVTRKDAKMVEFLLKHEKLDVNSQDYFGTTALHVAARNGYMEIAKLLLARGADVNLTDKEGETPLHNSILTMHCLELIPLLMGRGANIHARRAEEGSTVLHLAARTGEVKIYKCLLEFGADPDMRTFELKDIVDGEEVVTRSYSARELYRKLYPEKIQEFEAAEREVEIERDNKFRSIITVGSKKRVIGSTETQGIVEENGYEPEGEVNIENSSNIIAERGSADSSPDKPSANSQGSVEGRWVSSIAKKPRLSKDFINPANDQGTQQSVVRGS